MNFFDGLRNILDKVVDRLRVVTADRDPDSFTNKSIFNHLYLKRFVIASAVAFVGFLVFMIFSNGKELVFGNVEKMNAKLRDDTGLVDISMVRSSVFTKDPSSELDKKLGGKLGGDTAGVSKAFDTGLKDSGITSSSNDRLPTAAECSNLIDKMKSGEVTIGDDKNRIKECLDNNVLDLPDDEKRMFQAINNGDLTPEERKRLLDGLSDKNVDKKNMAKAIASTITDPVKESFRGALQKALSESDEGAATAISKKILDLPLTENEKAKVSTVMINGDNAVESLKKALGNKQGGANKGDLMEKAVRQAKKDAEDAANKQGIADEAAQSAKNAFKKAGDGQPLTPDDNAAISRAASTRVAADEAIAKVNANKEVLREASIELQSSISEINSIVHEELYTGYTIYDAEGKPIEKSPKKKSSTIVSNGAGKKVIIERRPMMEIDRIRESLSGSTSKFKRRASIDQKDMVGFAANVAVSTSPKDGVTKLSKDIKVFAVLDSKILYAQGGTSQRVVYRIMGDVYHPKTSELLIPSGSYCYAKTSSFDEQNGTMQQRCTEVAIGGGKTLDLSFSVGGIDGSEGITGEVYDSKGRYYGGTIVTSLASGVVGFLSQTTISEYMTSKDMQDIILGSALGGAATVLKEIAENTAKEMQQAPRILRVPRGVPVILYGDN